MSGSATRNGYSSASWTVCAGLRFATVIKVRLLSRNQLLLNPHLPRDRRSAGEPGYVGVRHRRRDRGFRRQAHQFRPVAGPLGHHRSRRGAWHRAIPVFYYASTSCISDGNDVRSAPLLSRKAPAAQCVSFSTIRCASPHIASRTARPRIRAACERGRRGCDRQTGRRALRRQAASKNWLKLKCSRDQEFVVVGYTAPKGSRVGLAAPLLGYHNGDDLVYAGKVGTGLRHPRRCAPCITRLSRIARDNATGDPGADPGTRRPMGAPETGRAGGVQRVDARREAAPPALCRSAHRQGARRSGQGDTLMARINNRRHPSGPGGLSGGRHHEGRARRLLRPKSPKRWCPT